MKNLLFCSFLGTVLLFLLNEFNKDRIFVMDFFPKGKAIILNPLDGVLGDKKMDNGSVRKDNFQSILQLKASCLEDSSGLYVIQKMTKDVFLLNRKKFFNNNRRYSLFVKTDGNRIVSYHAVNDLVINGAVFSENRIYFIGDDYTGITSELQSTYAVKINCMNLNFKKEWSTVSNPNRSYFFFGTGLKLINDKLIATLEIQGAGSSTICITTYDMILNKGGKPEGQKYYQGYQCGPAPDEINVLQLFSNFPPDFS